MIRTGGEVTLPSLPFIGQHHTKTTVRLETMTWSEMEVQIPTQRPGVLTFCPLTGRARRRREPVA
jgi:hypothetical protein